MHQWRVCHVLPTGDSDPCPRGTDYKEIAEYILYAKEKDAPCREPKIRQWNIFRYWHEWQQEVKICKCGFRNIIQLM